MELHGQAYLTSGLWRGRNQWYFMKRKRRNESKREEEEKGRGGITNEWMWNKRSTDLSLLKYLLLPTCCNTAISLLPKVGGVCMLSVCTQKGQNVYI